MLAQVANRQCLLFFILLLLPWFGVIPAMLKDQVEAHHYRKECRSGCNYKGELVKGQRTGDLYLRRRQDCCKVNQGQRALSNKPTK